MNPGSKMPLLRTGSEAASGPPDSAEDGSLASSQAPTAAGNYLTVPSIAVCLGLVNINQCCIEVSFVAVKPKSMVHHIAITKARVNLGQVVRRAHLNNEYFILEKDGIPVAGILGIAELEDYLELQNPALKAQIRKGYQGYRQGKVRSAPAFLKELQKPRLK